jgi:hypothetical protein
VLLLAQITKTDGAKMAKIKIQIKRRAVELFSKDTPFKPKVVKSKKLYSRKTKYKTNHGTIA